MVKKRAAAKHRTGKKKGAKPLPKGKPGRRTKAEIAALPEFANKWPIRPFYTTDEGLALQGDALGVLKQMPDKSVQLIFTSPPYALQKKKKYGNETQDEYVKWFGKFVTQFKRVLTDNGSLVINVGGAWEPGHPVRSIYHYELLVNLVRNKKLKLAQDFFWYNPAKIPNPAQWVNIDRIRVKDAVEPIWWLSKVERPFANNREVLTPYTKSMKKLLKNGYNDGPRPSGWVVSKVWGRDNGGAIPPNYLTAALSNAEADELTGDLSNVLAVSNTDSNSRYQRLCRENDLALHPARFPASLPEFFINFLTKEGDIVLDPFAGSNTTGEVAQRLKRRWVAIDLDASYLAASSYRFEKLKHAPPKDAFVTKTEEARRKAAAKALQATKREEAKALLLAKRA